MINPASFQYIERPDNSIRRWFTAPIEVILGPDGLTVVTIIIFLLMPILIPLADLVGVTRQTTVIAYCFGDGFSNMIYPTNPVLLICLGLTMVSIPKWLKWTFRFWIWVLLVTFLFLGIAAAIVYGPF